jgi:large subunit ribosomal protein L10
MPTEAKQAEINELLELLREAPITIVSDHRGLSVAALSKVRRDLRDKDVRYRVVKNRLARIAAEQAGRPELVPLLSGPSALAVGGTDETNLAKSVLDAMRPFKVEIRGAAMSGQTIDAAAVTALASMPPREVLLAQLAGAIASPLGTMAGLLAAPLRNLGYGLTQLQERRGSAPSA